MTALLLALLLVLFGTNQVSSGVVGVSIDEDEFVLRVGATRSVTAVVETIDGASSAVRWFSDDPSVVRVDADGIVTALAEGTAIVTAISDVSAVRSDSVRIIVSDQDVPSIANLAVVVESRGRLSISWEIDHADRIEVSCAGGAGPPLARVEGQAAGTTIGIPSSACRTLRIQARGAPVDASAEIELSNVVWTGEDAQLGGTPIPGSLRQVVATAEAGSVIGFASDVRDVVLAGKAYSGANDAHLVLDRDVTISAAADDPVTIRSDAAQPVDGRGIPVRRTRVLYVAPTASVALQGLVIRGGTFNPGGGAVRNDGQLEISDSLLEENQSFYRGGAIHNLGTLRVENSTIRANRAIVTSALLAADYACIDDVARSCSEGDVNFVRFGTGGSGGGLYNEAGVTQLVNTVVIDNLAVYSGGGIYVDTGRVELTDSEVRNNVASDEGVGYETYSFGGGIANFSPAGVSMTRGAVIENVSDNVGGGLSNGGNDGPDLPMTLRDVRVEGNRAGDFGGGIMHYFLENRDTLRELGTTDVVGNIAGEGPGGDDGDERYADDVAPTQ